MTMMRDLVLLVFVLGGAVLGSQLPPFSEAYAQRLGGALDELRTNVAGFERAARSANMSFDEYRVRFRNSENQADRATGEEIDRVVARTASLSAHQRELDNAGPWSKPLLVLTSGDAALLERTWNAWIPTLTLDLRWGGIGLLLGWLLHGTIAGLIGLMSGPPRRRGGLRS